MKREHKKKIIVKREIEKAEEKKNCNTILEGQMQLMSILWSEILFEKYIETDSKRENKYKYILYSKAAEYHRIKKKFKKKWIKKTAKKASTTTKY